MYLVSWQVDLGRMVPVNEVILYCLYLPDFVVRVGKVAKNIDIYIFCSQLTRKRRKHICTVTIPFMKDSSREISISCFLVNHRDFYYIK